MGTGQTGRLAMDHLLVPHGPPSITIHEEDRGAYYAAFGGMGYPAGIREALIKCGCGTLRVFCAANALRFFEIHKVFLQNRAFLQRSGSRWRLCRLTDAICPWGKNPSQIALADLISPSLGLV